MEVKNLSSYDNYLACNLVIPCLNTTRGSWTTVTSNEFCISNDVIFQCRSTVCTSRREIDRIIKESLFIKFSGPHNISVRLQCKFLNINKKYAVDDSEWRLIRETDSPTPNYTTYDLDLTFEIEPSFDMPLSFAPLYDDTELTDFELYGEDGSVQIHSAALAASSPALRRMLKGKWTETQDRALKIPKTSNETLQHLKDFIYLNVLPETGVQNLLLMASCYMMDDLIEKCTTHIIKNLKADDATAVIKFALDNNLTKLYAGVLECIEKGVLKVKDISKKHSF